MIDAVVAADASVPATAAEQCALNHGERERRKDTVEERRREEGEEGEEKEEKEEEKEEQGGRERRNDSLRQARRSMAPVSATGPGGR